MEPLGVKLARDLAELTLAKSGEIGLANAATNLPYIKKTILDLESELEGRMPSSAVIVGAGPSLHRRNPAAAMRDAGYQGAIVACDGALGYCLRNGVVPQYMVAVDPHPYRVIRWLGDPDLASRPEDDYFLRQDLDPIHHDEIRANNELLQAVNKHGKDIKAILSTSMDPGFVRRCLDAGMEIYWWNPLYDDYDAPNSYSRRVFELTGAPCMVTGGNVGSCAYVFANVTLHAPHVALVGFDLGYAPGTPLRNTQYYREIQDLLGDRADEALITLPCPFGGEDWLTDPTYYWYGECLREIVDAAPCQTYNCTEGGVFSGKGVTIATFQAFLERVGSLPALAGASGKGHA